MVTVPVDVDDDGTLVVGADPSVVVEEELLPLVCSAAAAAAAAALLFVADSPFVGAAASCCCCCDDDDDLDVCAARVTREAARFCPPRLAPVLLFLAPDLEETAACATEEEGRARERADALEEACLLLFLFILAATFTFIGAADDTKGADDELAHDAPREEPCASIVKGKHTHESTRTAMEAKGETPAKQVALSLGVVSFPSTYVGGPLVQDPRFFFPSPGKGFAASFPGESSSSEEALFRNALFSA